MSTLSGYDRISLWCLQLVIGPAASAPTTTTTIDENASGNDHPAAVAGRRSSSASSLLFPFWRTLFLVVFVVECRVGTTGTTGVVDFLEHHLEYLVVPLYTSLVLLYLLSLILSGVISRRSKKVEEEYGVAVPRSVEPTVSWVDDTKTTKRHDDHYQQQQPQQQQPQEQEQTQFLDVLSGSYKLVENDGFENFLAVQGVPWALRRAANQARPIHKITHCGNRLTIQIKGLVESQTTYCINGPPVQTNVRGRIFLDSVTYIVEKDDNDNNDEDEDNNNNSSNKPAIVRGIQVSKTAVTEDYDITVQRRLSRDGQTITVTSRATFRDGRDPVQCVQTYTRISES